MERQELKLSPSHDSQNVSGMQRLVRVIAVANCYNEAENLPESLHAVNNQRGINLVVKVMADDASSDNSPDIAESLGWNVVRMTWKHESLVATPWIPHVFNQGLKRAYEILNGEDFDYLLVAPCDIILPEDYTIKIIEQMEQDGSVIGSGAIQGERQSRHAPRGAGRVYKKSFFIKYIRLFPDVMSWESWALIKAKSRGFLTRAYTDPIMFGLRKTNTWRHTMGEAMRTLGYFPPYALIVAILAMFHNIRYGVRILAKYISYSRDLKHTDDRMRNIYYRSQAWSLFRSTLTPQKTLSQLGKRLIRDVREKINSHTTNG